MVQQFGLELEGIRAIEPLVFLEFLQPEARARRSRARAGGLVEYSHPGGALRDAAGEHGEAGDRWMWGRICW